MEQEYYLPPSGTTLRAYKYVRYVSITTNQVKLVTDVACSALTHPQENTGVGRARDNIGASACSIIVKK
jgi:hypothetical protein